MRYRVQLINRLLQEKKLQTAYLEIGCHRDRTFSKVSADVKVGVDPKSGGTVRMTSDEFFQQNQQRFDVVFIDGLHHWEQVIRDVQNSLNFLNPGGVILLHDCLPQAREHQLRDKVTRSWNGDVWRAVVELRQWVHVDTVVVNKDQGMGIVVPRANTSLLRLERHLDYGDVADEVIRVIEPDGVNGFLERDGGEAASTFGDVWFRHILLTTIKGEGLEVDWLDVQLKLFERFTAPSVAWQSIRRFEWVVQCGPGIPNKDRSALAEFREGGLCTVIEADGPKMSTGLFMQTRKHLAAGSERKDQLVISSLDPGDSLMRDYVLLLQHAILPDRAPEWLCFPQGAMWAAGHTSSFEYAQNPFRTLVMPTVAVLCSPHAQDSVGCNHPVREIEPGRPMWMQSVENPAEVAKQPN